MVLKLCTSKGFTKPWQMLYLPVGFHPCSNLNREGVPKLDDVHETLVWFLRTHTTLQCQATLWIHEPCVCQSQQGWWNISPQIAEEQRKDISLCALHNDEDYKVLLIENTKVLCKGGKLVIPKSFQARTVAWYHHYLQHPGHLPLEEMLRAAMYWKSMHTTVWLYVKKCRACQITNVEN
jgi:hypothetical protein